MGTSNVLDENGNVQSHVFQIGGGSIASEFGAVEMPPDPRKLRSPVSQAFAEVFDAEGKPRAVARKIAAPSAPQETAPSKATAVKPPTLAAMMRQLRGRLHHVEREIRIRKTLEKERDQIKRLIAAAEQERDNLRRIRSAG